MYARLLIWGFVLLTGFSIAAQGDRKAPGIAAIALDRGEWELILNNTIGLNASPFNWVTKPHRLTDRQYSAYSGLLQLTRGLDRARRVNIGLDLGYNRLLTGSEPASGLLAGPRLRWRPFGDFDRTFDVTMQHFLRVQWTGADSSFAANRPLYWGNELILTKFMESDALRAHFILIGQIGFNVLPSRWVAAGVDRKTPFETPVNLFAGIFPQRNLLFFVGANINPEFGTVPWADDATYFRRRTALNAIGGGQITFNNTLFIFATYAKAVLKEGEVYDQTLSLGLRLTFGDYGYF